MLHKKVGGIIATTVLALTLTAHIGSPDTIWEGHAGAWPVRVIIRDPGVIPGLAEIIVRTSGPAVSRVTVTAAVWNADGGAPPPDVAHRVPGDSSLWSAGVWFMTATSYGVKVHLSGAAGEGDAVIPFVARASRVTPLDLWLGTILGALGVLLVAGMTTIVMSAVRESNAPAGSEPNPRARRHAWIGGAATATGLLVVVWLGNQWWSSEADAYAQGVIASQPFRTTARVEKDGAAATLTLSIADSIWSVNARQLSSGTRRGLLTGLLPDHGRVMHAFVVSDDGDGFAHVHPVPNDSGSFVTALPPLPAGRYRVFADIVHESGWSQTLSTVVEIPAGVTQWTATDDEDAWKVVQPVTDSIADLGDGLRLVRRNFNAALQRGEDITLEFSVVDLNGAPVTVDPYLGMAGHLVLLRDSTVFIHLHPAGTASVAATEALRARMQVAVEGSHQMDSGSLSGELRFPYVFPQAGTYRVWVQVRVAGKVRTGAFSVAVSGERLG